MAKIKNKTKDFTEILKKKKKYKDKFKIRIVNFGCFKLKYILCVCGEELIAYELEQETCCFKCETNYRNSDVEEMGRLII